MGREEERKGELMKKERIVLSYQKMQEVVDGINTDDRSGTGVAVALMTVKAVLGDIIYKLEQAELEGNENEKGEVRMEFTEERWEKAYEYAKQMLKAYRFLGSAGISGAMHIASKIDLYESGDRSAALLEALEAIE